jgi:hypothetical protein
VLEILLYTLTILYLEKEICMYKYGLTNAHPALCNTFIEASYSISAVTPQFLNISLNLNLIIYYYYYFVYLFLFLKINL